MSKAEKPTKGDTKAKQKPVTASRGSSPDLPRLLSVSAIIVALAVAGALAIEGVVSRDPIAPVSETLTLSRPEPAPVSVQSEADLLRIRQLERRTSLLERQIVVLQIELAAEQKKSADLKTQVSELDAKFTDASNDTDTEVTMAAAPQKDATPAPAPEKMETATPHPEPDAAPEPVRVAKAPELADVKAEQPEKTEQPEATPSEDIVVIDNTKPDTDKPDMKKAAAPETPEEPKQMTAAEEETPADTIVTGSIDQTAKPVPAMAPAEQDIAALVKPNARKSKPGAISHTRFALAFDLYDKVDQVKAAWKKLETAQPELLGELEARALPQGTQEGELKYRLLAGPFSNAAAATRRCAKLRRSGIKCRTKVYGGEALDTPPSPGTLIKVEVVADTDPDTLAKPKAKPRKVVRSSHLEALLAKPPVPRRKPIRRIQPRS